MPNPKTTSISVKFKLSFIAATTFTFLCFFVAIVLSFIDNPNDFQRELFTTCNQMWKVGFGIIVGLLGGKVA